MKKNSTFVISNCRISIKKRDYHLEKRLWPAFTVQEGTMTQERMTLVKKRKESTLVNSEGSPQPTTQYMSRRGWVSSNHCICRTTIDVGKNWRKRIRKETKPTTSLKRFLSSSTTSQVTHTYREHQCKKKDSKIEVNYQNKGSLKRNEVKNGSIQNHCWLYTANCIGYEQKRL